MASKSIFSCPNILENFLIKSLIRGTFFSSMITHTCNDGSLAYPSSGDVIDVKTRRVVAQLTDEEGRAVGSEKLLEIDWDGDTPVQAGNQFGVGRATE